jgi:hypothetical protein
MIDATFIISNRSAVFEEAAAENSGYYRQRRFRFRAINPILSYPVYFPPVPGQCRVADPVLLEFDRLCWGRLGRPCDRPLLDLFLFTQKIVYFGL